MSLTNSQKQLFQKLQADREENAKVMKKPSMKSLLDAVADKYSDIAHFIYEVLQNADDVGATEVRFILKYDGLTLIHNGYIRFTISDVETEEKDKLNGKLGHINAITSMAQSNKISTEIDKPTIGKFGVGFKSTFSYTDTPHIYDDPFCFKITERFNVPVLLEDDLDLRKPNETVFYFPFDKKTKTPEQCYQEIFEKLKNLNNPILFLNNLQKISWEVKIDDNKSEVGSYSKTILSEHQYGDIKVQEIQQVKNINVKLHNKIRPDFNKDETQKLYLFITPFQSHTCSIAYRVDDNNQVQYDTKIPAYCFFETKETTHLKFFIQAPFLLNDSREGIPSFQQHNKDVIQKLAKLTADSLPICRDLGLINDNFFNVLPINKNDFYSSYSNSATNQFSPIYDTVLQKLKTDKLLPVNNGSDFTTSSYAYLADGIKLISLFNQPAINNKTALAVLTNNNRASWVFTTVTDNQEILWKYIRDNLVQDTLEPEKIARIITKEFIEKQTDQWLIEFYTFLLTVPSLWRKNSVLRYKEIIRLENGNHVAPYNKNQDDQPLAFLPTKSTNLAFPFVKKCFVQNYNSLEFFKQLGISRPDKKAEIYQLITKYEDAQLIRNFNKLNENELDLDGFDFLADFEQFFLYFCEYRDDHFLQKLKSISFCIAYDYLESDDNENLYIVSPLANYKIYLPNFQLLNYFENTENIESSPFILSQEFYQEIYNNYEESDLNKFLNALGIFDRPSIININYHDHNSKLGKFRKLDLDIKYSQIYSIIDFNLDGLTNCLNYITKEKSLYLWEILLDLNQYYHGNISYKYHTQRYQTFPSELTKQLQNTAWLYDKNDQVRKPSEIKIEDLAEDYELDYAEDLIKVLKFYDQASTENLIKNFIDILPEDDQQIFMLIKKLKEQHPDLTMEEILKGLNKIVNQDEKIINSPNKNSQSNHNQTQGNTQTKTQTEEKEEKNNHSRPPHLNPLIDEITRSSDKIKQEISQGKLPKLSSKTTDNLDSDEYNPQPIDLAQEIEKLKEKVALEIAQLERKDELKQQVSQFEKYSVGWFKTLLELEYEETMESRARKNPIQVCFRKVELDRNSEEVLILSDTNFIPHSIEDCGELSLTLNFKNESKSILVEAVSPRQKMLKAKVKNKNDLLNLDLTKVETAMIEVKNADFILERLKNAFEKLFKDTSDNYNLQQKLPSNLKFIFGPPCTGKTTYLVTQEILPQITQSRDNLRILVLTPTNKAADVLTETVMRECEKSGNNSYYNWLIRYGETQSAEVENTVYAKSKYLDATVLNKMVFVTTIARFPYDTFKVKNDTLKGKEDESFYTLRDFKWDYIIFDEASMINLASIVHVLYNRSFLNTTKCQFIIGGDPFQINPVIQVKEEGWKDGNIYSLVGLNQKDSFLNPLTIPHQFEVINLTTQYRSIPQLGNLFSQFTYNGILKHNRSDDDSREIIIDNLDLKPITIINFKISHFETIYKARKLKGSPYHIYSALLTVELVKYITENIYLDDLKYEEKPYRLGIICPYRIQQNIIDKLLTKMINNNNIEVITGTVHGFQGDECEMIISLFNPPVNISQNSEIFLNKQNLLNVAISRAKDYLIMLLPHDNTGYIKTEQLHYIEDIKHKVAQSGKHTQYSDQQIENIIFGQSNMIEELSFPTSHQNVNIYSNPDKKYEIRYDENAVDIQVQL